MKKMRLRFAPSPTGALHIGGVRTALYNYLLARQQGGTFILRIEDTDQTRYVPGAEEYIIEALRWCGLLPDEGPGFGGDYGPYRQSERQAIYERYARELVERGQAYYAFDTAEELDIQRQTAESNGQSFKYDFQTRGQLRNSLSLPATEVKALLDRGEPYTIRLRVPQDELIRIQDLVRGEVVFQSNELDDKILLKGDGMPTYHLANIVDDHLMEITHVIRGEEWLPSTAHHVLLYRALGWEDTMPQFAHLPLILKPNGQGKLSKRDGTRLGIPVFPLSWKGETPDDSFVGFREFGFDPRAVLNFLAFLGWNPGTEQELFSLEELIKAFNVEKIGKAGARFDFDKAKWFNQQHLMHLPDAELAQMVRPLVEAKGFSPTDAFLQAFCGMMKERVVLLTDFWDNGYYFFTDVQEYDQKIIVKKWTPTSADVFGELLTGLKELPAFTAPAIQESVETFIARKELKFGDVLPILRIGLTGTTKGPGVFEMMALFGYPEVQRRMERAFAAFNTFS
ncbi:MAG: glutamate--tRNA ligase [Lewinellaceae bacterium]|nr:glutamate--tRNA ligase [Lewinellaceae bacterium]